MGEIQNKWESIQNNKQKIENVGKPVKQSEK